MKKISEFKNEEAVDLLADIIDPCTIIVNDEEIRNEFTNNKMSAIKLGLKRYKKEVIQILARLEDVPVEEYECTPVTIITKFVELFNDEEFNDFLSSLAETEE